MLDFKFGFKKKKHENFLKNKTKHTIQNVLSYSAYCEVLNAYQGRHRD